MELPTVSNRAASTEHLAGSTPCLIKEKAQVGWLKDGLIPLNIKEYVSIKVLRTFGHSICTGKARGGRPNHLDLL